MSARLIALAIVLALGSPAQLSAQDVGISADGRKGNLHRVVPRDTLWDITAFYLGTPWIWPSIWQENVKIANPHLIYPGDLIWIAAGEMRKVSEEEAAALRARVATPDAGFPGAPDGGMAGADGLAGSRADGADGSDWRVRFPGVDRFGFISADAFEGSGAVLGSHDSRQWMSQQDEIVVSLGMDETEAGARYQLFRVRHKVRHPETGRMMGYFIEVLGETQVTETHSESSFATVTDAFAEIEAGDRLGAFEREPAAVVRVPARDGIEGVIISQQLYRIASAGGDLVVLDQGLSEGVVAGNQFVIFRAGERVDNPDGWGKVRMPDAEIGSLFVLRAGEHTSVALVVESSSEVAAGVHFRSQ